MLPAQPFTETQAATPALVLSAYPGPKPEKTHLRCYMKLASFIWASPQGLSGATLNESLESSRGRPRASRALQFIWPAGRGIFQQRPHSSLIKGAGIEPAVIIRWGVCLKFP